MNERRQVDGTEVWNELEAADHFQSVTPHYNGAGEGERADASVEHGKPGRTARLVVERARSESADDTRAGYRLAWVSPRTGREHGPTIGENGIARPELRNEKRKLVAMPRIVTLENR